MNDRSFMEEMKADILRRVQELSDDEEEYQKEKSNSKGILGPTFLHDEEANIVVVGDGEASSDSESENRNDKSEVCLSIFFSNLTE